MTHEVVITTGARLHFGFLAHRASGAARSTAVSDPPDNRESQASPLGGNNFGGVGLMVDSPGFVLSARMAERDEVVCNLDAAESDPATIPADCFESLSRRASNLVSRYRKASPARQPGPCRIELRRMIPPHRGLGSGTQLGLAVAQALALLARDGHLTPCELARRVGRGRRSAVGIHGFARGGFLVDAGKPNEVEIGRLVARVDVPDDWRFLLVSPSAAAEIGLSGPAELAAFEKLPEMPRDRTDRLCGLVLLEMLPALADANNERFGESLFEFGQLVGEYFRPVQGGIYALPRMVDFVEWIRGVGIRGVAQTSWGPTIAVCCPNGEEAKTLRNRIRADARWRDFQSQFARPLNTGAAIQL